MTSGHSLRQLQLTLDTSRYKLPLTGTAAGVGCASFESVRILKKVFSNSECEEGG